MNHKYLPADKYVVLNDNDPDLRPIVLSLPKPPDLKYIDGYGLPPHEQRFKRLEIPRRLIDLEAEAIVRAKSRLGENTDKALTLLKIQKEYWDLIRLNAKSLKKEIQFIRRLWWFRINGYWFFINGKPTYITGQHFYYLNFWTMDTDDSDRKGDDRKKDSNRPDYRDRDRKEFLFYQYSFTATETFAKLDENGFAIPEEDGSYQMIDTGRRICFGTVQNKNRRSGNTNKSLCIGLEITTRTIGTDGMGCQSYSRDNAEEHIKGKLMPAFEKLPLFFKPNSTSGRVSDELRFDVGKNDYGESSLQNKVTYATTASEKFYDGKKLVFILLDEQGKTANCSILKRWDVTRNVLAQGNGLSIHGYTLQPSTVDEVEAADNAFDYRKLCTNSNFYRRMKTTGQTYSGLFLLFIPASEGLDKKIDSYGFSVKDTILPHQAKENFTQTAHEYLLGKRNIFLADGSPEAMRAYREEKKLFPLQYSDSWLGTSGNIGFDMEKIDLRLAELNRSNNVRNGRLEWVNNVFGGDVYWVDDAENYTFSINWFPVPAVSNKRVSVTMYNFKLGTNQITYRPLFPDRGVVGADPYKQVGERDAKIIGGKTGTKTRLSSGGMAGYMKYDESIDGNVPRSMRRTDRFVMSYRHRYNNLDDYCEDVLKYAIWSGFMVYPETNLDTVWIYFLDKGFQGYLLYDIDPSSGQLKSKPGIDSLERSKQKLFGMLRDYIDFRCHQEDFAAFLNECKNIRGMEEMRSYDRIAAHGLSLMGAESTYTIMLGKAEDHDYDMQDFLWTM